MAPGHVASENDMWECSEFGVGIRSHLDVRKSLNDVERENITIDCSNALHSTGFERSVFDVVLEMFELHTRMDRTLLLMKCVLMHDKDDGSTL